MKSPHEMMAEYAQGGLTAEQVADLEAYLRESPERIELFVRQTMLDCHLTELLHEQNVQDVAMDLSDDSQFGLLLQALDAPKGSVRPLDFTQVIQRDRKPQPAPTHHDSVSARDIVTVGGYVLRQALMSKPAILASIAAAAVLILTLIVINPFASDTPDLNADVPNDPAAMAASPAPAPPVVATLTATHNAIWAEGASATGPDSAPGPDLTPGSHLHPNQRLSLTAGYAEITTARGAVVILEAPCTIELIDHHNALRLTAGKLVGICETDTSKGFIVRTPHLDITDIGTRFGIVSNEKASRLHVIEGEVEVSSLLADTHSPATRLVTGQGVMLDTNTRQLQSIEDADIRFAHSWRAIADAPRLTGPIRYEPSIPSDLRIGGSEDSDVLMFHERSGVMLDKAVAVDVVSPGRYQASDLIQPHVIQGQRVDSYLVHLDSEDGSDNIARRTFTIEFDRPILGVIAHSKQLAASHRQFAVPGVAYGNQSDWSAFDNHDSSGIDITTKVFDQDQNDAVRLSDDRRTLTVTLAVGDAIDQIRVLVQSVTEPIQ